MDRIITQMSSDEVYMVVPQNYKYYMTMESYYGNTNTVKYNAVLPSVKLKRIWNRACKSIKNDIKQTIKKFDSSAEPLTEIEKQAYLPQKLKNDIVSEQNNFYFGEKTIVDEVIIVKKGTSIKKKGSKIPSNVDMDEKVELKLDVKKLEKIKINTSEIHNVLQEIFTDEQAEVLKSEPVETIHPENENNAEIKSDLQSIVNVIIEKENRTRNELLNIIQNKGMVLSSAIDEINKCSEEKYGDFLVEENHDVYIVNEDIVNLIKNKE